MAMKKLELRYLQGLIGKRTLPSEVWVPEEVIPSDDARAIYSVLLHMKDMGSVMTPEVVVERLVDSQLMGIETAKEFMTGAATRKMAPAELREIRDILSEKYANDETKRQLTKLIASPKDARLLENSLVVLRNMKAMQPSRTVSVATQASRAVQKAFNAEAHVIPWFLSDLRGAFQGLTRKEVSILAGRPGNGKTTFAIFNAFKWALAGYKVGFFSKEMPAENLVQKILSGIAEVNNSKFRTGDLTDYEKDRLMQASMQFVERAGERLCIYDDVYSVSEMESLLARNRFDVVVDDFIQFTEMQESNIRIEIKRILKQYKQMSKEYNVAFLALSQLNRAVEERDDFRPRSSDLAESGSLEQFACDIYFIFFEKYYRQRADPRHVEIIATKCRYGVPHTVDIGFDGGTATYYDWEDEVEEDE